VVESREMKIMRYEFFPGTKNILKLGIKLLLMLATTLSDTILLSTFLFTRGIGPHKIWKVLGMTVRTLLAIVSHSFVKMILAKKKVGTSLIVFFSLEYDIKNSAKVSNQFLVCLKKLTFTLHYVYLCLTRPQNWWFVLCKV